MTDTPINDSKTNAAKTSDANIDVPRITVRPNGSLRIDGEIPLFDHEGNALEIPTGKPYALCRCGASSRKPFCDGSHKTIEFDSTIGPIDP